MQELLNIIRQQLVLCQRLVELHHMLSQELVKANAKESARISHDIEQVMNTINTVERKKTDFLIQHQASDMASLLAAQPHSPQRDMAEQLLKKQSVLLQQLKDANGNNLQYLDRNAKFIDFSINVVTQTSAGVTYGTPGDNGGKPVQGRKMFEAGV